MSRAIWKFVNANHETNFDFVQAMGGEFGAATEHTLVLAFQPGLSIQGPSIVFKGDFVLANGVVQSGTITGFDLYEDGVKIAKAKGYDFSYADLLAAASAAKIYDFSPAKALIAKETTYHGSNDDNGIFGNDLDGRLLGKGGNDEMEGGLGNDILKGGKGDDTLQFVEGHDRAIGGAGSDTFLFRDEIGAFSVDKVKDFHPGEDIMQLGFDTFGILTPGELLDSEFHIGKQAADADDHVIYRTGKGALYFDVDGVGGEAQVQFAKVTKGLVLDHSDFLVEGLT